MVKSTTIRRPSLLWEKFEDEEEQGCSWWIQSLFYEGRRIYTYLERKIKSVYWCTVFALSNPLYSYFYEECYHEYTETDVTVEQFDSLFQQFLIDALGNLKEKEISYNKLGQGGNVKNIIAQHLRNWVAKFVCTAAHPPLIPEVVNVEWSGCVNFGLSHVIINLLVLTDTIKYRIDRHLRLRKHLYFYRNQTYSKMIINSTCYKVLAKNYTRKLHTKQWIEGQQDFRVMMNKGTYYHMATLTQNVTE